MKLERISLNKLGSILLASVFLTPTPLVSAASSPNLGAAASYGILSSTYSNTASGTTINGDLGYTTPPATNPTVNGTTYTPTSPSGTNYAQAGIDQSAALAALNSQSCTHNFPAGPVDLASDTSHGTAGVYTPGVYCTTASSAASIGSGTISFSGSGTYIFRINGAFTTAANTSVVLTNGASACEVWWTPNEATTLGANSTFLGANIDDAGITIGSTVSWTGRVLAFGGTVTSNSDTITVPTCNSSTTNTPGSGAADLSSASNNAQSASAATPGFPNAGADASSNNMYKLWWIIPGLILLIPSLIYLIRRHLTSL